MMILNANASYICHSHLLGSERPFSSSQRYTQLMHYYTYEWGSFIADVGGFLGLLLGYSVLRDDTYVYDIQTVEGRVS